MSQPTPAPDVDAARPPWQAERSLDRDATLSLVARRFPDLAGRPLTPVGSGWDNDVWRVSATAADPAWLVRVPRRAIGAELLPIEAAVLPHVEARVARPLGVAVPGSARLARPPGPRGHGRAATDPAELPWPVMAVRPVEGEEVGRTAAPVADRAALAEPLAAFLRRLHAISPDEGVRMGAKQGRHITMNVERSVVMARARLGQARAAGLQLPSGVDQALEAEAATWGELVPRPVCLCHGDLHLRHVLVDGRATELRGIIDWGDVHVGDPAIDLAVVPLVLPPSAWDAFVAAYGPIDDAAWRVARMRAWTAAAALAVSCHDVGEAAVCADALAALARLTATSGARCDKP